MSDLYIAVIGDVINSKKIKNRFEAQEKLIDTLEYINDRFYDDIEANFMISLGDEFQGLLRLDSNLSEIINIIELKMFPVKIRFGIGIGLIDSSIKRDKSVEIVGDAYYKARNAIVILEGMRKKKESIKTNVFLISSEHNHEIDELINSIFSLIFIIKSSWNDKRTAVILNYITYSQNQKILAEKLNIDQSWVSKLLSSSDYYSVKRAYLSIDESLRRCC